MDLKTEQNLIEQARHDSAAFGQLFDEYYSPIFGYILKRVGDPAAAQDIVAETFLKSYQNIGKFKWQNVSICSWFYKIATNELRMYFRSNKYAPKSLELLFETDGFEPVSDQDLAEEVTAAQEQVQRDQQFIRAQQILATLPLKYQEVIALRFAEKKKLSEIALILNKKEGTVKSLLSRGLSLLRKHLEVLETQPNPASGIVEIEGPLLLKPQESYED